MNQPLGILRSGPCAFVDERGTVASAGADVRLQWWVRGEDRWHRTDVDAAVRQALLDDTPVVETVLRVPGGDAVGVAYAFATGDDAAVAGRVTNASPVPIAVALVVGPARSVRVDGSSVVIDDDMVVHLSRRPSVSVCAPTLDALADALDGATAVTEEMSGYAAVVVPLPHSQTTAWQIGRSQVATPVPEPEAVVAGWQRHAEEGAQVVVPDPYGGRFARARHIVAIGPSRDASLAEVAAHVGAQLRLGWFDAALPGTDRLAAAQRGSGRIGDDGPTTIAALDALAAWRLAGIPAGGLEHLIGPVVGGARWLTRRMRRFDADTQRAARRVLIEAAGFLHSIGQAEAADHMMRAVDASDAPLQEPADATRAPEIVTSLLDALMVDEAGGLVVLPGWRAGWGRAPVEVSAMPTASGLTSWALRWHGARPALLWEVEPWPQVSRSEPTVRAPQLDSAWRGIGWRGEGLLAAPDSLADPPVSAGESFS